MKEDVELLLIMHQTRLIVVRFAVLCISRRGQGRSRNSQTWLAIPAYIGGVHLIDVWMRQKL